MTALLDAAFAPPTLLACVRKQISALVTPLATTPVADTSQALFPVPNIRPAGYRKYEKSRLKAYAQETDLPAGRVVAGSPGTGPGTRWDREPECVVEYPRDSRVCQFLLRRRWVSLKRIHTAAEQQRLEREDGSAPRPLDQILQDGGALDSDQAKSVAEYAAATPTPPLGGKRLAATLAPRAQPDGETSAPSNADGDATENETGTDAWVDVARTLPPGTPVGPFTLVGRIGRGGGGTVYLARPQPGYELQLPRPPVTTGSDADGPLVALKVFTGDRSLHGSARERFLREARVACLLRHEGVVAGLDAGPFEDGFYYAMEYIEGRSMREAIDHAGRLPESQVLAIAIAVARALDFIHGLGFVHRDIKPDNILLGADGTIRLCDLGLAREIRMNSEVTTSGAALGTPRYIAPEQARGDRNVDGRADIYSLGITLFHALVGEPPFLGESGIVVMSRHLYEDVPPIRTRCPEINAGLDRVVLRMTRRTRILRHPSSIELVRDLVDIATGPTARTASSSSPAANRLAG